ncbi:MAG: response regulator [Rhodocyclaceae bacterium]|nr:response regulator [Rhodocyclaceae bacterium]
MDKSLTPLLHVVDDDAALRRALIFLLESSGWQVAAYDSAEAFLEGRREPTRPGCLVLDIRMPLMSGLELQRILNDRGVCLPVIFLTGHADVSMVVQAMKLGACDFIEKPFKDQTLLDAICQAVRRDLAQRDENDARRVLCERINKLSPRELDVARLVAEGLPNKIIGLRLDISERTVQVHRQHLMEKLDIHSAAELAQMMLRACQGGA